MLTSKASGFNLTSWTQFLKRRFRTGPARVLCSHQLICKR
jgi:hypothetical protein